MKEITKEKFIRMGEQAELNIDNVFAVRIKKRKIYFIGWMEDSEGYKYQKDHNFCSDEELNSETIKRVGLVEAITNTHAYNNDMVCGWSSYPDGVSEDLLEEYSSEYDAFCAEVGPDYILWDVSMEDLFSDACLGIDGDKIIVVRHEVLLKCGKSARKEAQDGRKQN